MTLISKAFSKRITPIATFGGAMGQPPKTTMEQFLRAYGEIGWFHAVVSFIGRGVAEVDWYLNRVQDGESEEITAPHPIKSLLNNPNPFQTGHDLIELTQIYEDLTGEGYWHLDQNNGKNELWSFQPHRIKVVISNTEYITGYVFMAGDGDIPLLMEDVIPFITPNPLTPWRGVSPAQSIGIELDTQTYANQTNRFYFYNGATMGLIISYPADVAPEEYTRLKEQFNADHRGYGRAHRATVLSGGPTISQAGQSFGSRDMDFVNMLKNGRDAILGAYGIPYSVLGGSEHVNRATAEAAQVDVATRVIRPRLFKKRETLNRLLVPKFVTKETPKSAYHLLKAMRDNYGYWTADADKRIYEIKSRLNIEGSLTDGDNMEEVWKAVGESTTLQLDFDNPVAADDAQNTLNANALYSGNVIKLNEARGMVDFDADETPAGNQYFNQNIPKAANPFDMGAPTPDNNPTILPEEPAKGLKKKSINTLFPNAEAKEIYWKKYVKQAESFEPKFITAIQKIFDDTKAEVSNNCKSGINRDSKLFNVTKFRESYKSAILPVITEAMSAAIKNGRELIEPQNPHKDFPSLLNQFALAWLNNRIMWAALQVGDTTEEMLRQALADGFANGESIDDIASRIMDIPGFADANRAQMIARTETIAASSQGALEGYRDAGCNMTEFYTAQDEKTCEYCDNYNEQVTTIAEAMPIPLHPNCRCVYLPVIT
jgi:HK97 family phage portal protein